MGDAADDMFDAAMDEYLNSSYALKGAKRMDSMGDMYVDCQVEYKARTEMAILVCQLGKEVWVPRSLLAYTTDKLVNSLARGNSFTMRVRQWYADQHDLEQEGNTP